MAGSAPFLLSRAPQAHTLGTTMKRYPGLRRRARPIAACAVLVFSAWAAHAQEPAQPPRTFTVAAQALGLALAQLGRESGREIILSADLVRGRQTAGVRSAASFEQALEALLAGTGLIWRVNEAGTIVIESQPAQREHE